MKVILNNRLRHLEQLEPSSLRQYVQEEHAAIADERLITLASILQDQVSIDMLVGLEFPQVYRWLQKAMEFLDHRSTAVKVELCQLGAGDRYFLFCNAPDANHIFSSIQEYLHRQSLQFRAVSHPIISMQRNDGKLVSLGADNGEGIRESFVWILLERLPQQLVNAVKQDLNQILTAALQISSDRQATLARIGTLKRISGLSCYGDLFDWLLEDNYIPVAYRSYVLSEQGGAADVSDSPETALGIEQLYNQVLSRDQEPVNLLDVVLSSRLFHGGDVAQEKTEQRSPIHRFERLTYLGFREPLPGGQVREHAFWGFYTQKSIDENTFSIPSLRRRIEKAQADLGIRKESHNYRKTVQIFNTFPKVELFLLGEAELRRLLRSFVQLHRQAGVKVVVAPSMSELGLTLLLIMPKEFYTPDHLQRIDAYLERHFRATSVESRIIHLSVDYLSLHVNLRLRTAEVHLDLIRLEQGLTRLAQPWKLKFRHLLEKSLPDAGGLWQRYSKVFKSDYRERTHPRFAVRDVQNIEKLLSLDEDVFDIWGPFPERGSHYRLQFYSRNESYLNDLMPYLENLNLCVIEEVDFTLEVDEQRIYIKSFAIRPDCVDSLSMDILKPLLIDVLGALRRGLVENDYLNRLLPLTGLSWKEISVFRAYRNYYFQLGSPFTKRRAAFALLHNHQVALLLYRYFEGRFRDQPEWRDPLDRETLVLSPVRQQLLDALEKVADTNEDQILRTLFNLIDSSVRCNFFIRRDQPDFFFSFKVSSLGVIDMPSPRPLYEVYVHSNKMEGVHLRGGKVARGGIRWSDRPDDFRTEVLGLVKAQMTKNAVIVPVGSKGGFIVKTPFTDREEGGRLVKEAYQTLMRGLLDLTDNRTRDGVVRSPGIVAYDDEDPYLVVAADKGTAHLPDTANAVSEEYGFWLGDAFASGGSHGYDHKKLGITARGAWVSVMRHFRETGHNTQTEPFSVIGIGDMSGDVFGNGMLLSRQIRLLAAFDHRHIFLDPDPDPEVSYQERERLFRLPRSSWEDYNPELISAGGGVFSRQAKDIPLSPQIRDWLGVRQTTMDVAGLIQLLLTAKADLLWNGGIGTYVKASFETHDDAGDRGNDAVRIDATQLQVKVVGEGGNLGLTQQARIEYAQNGGRINTDAVDNSAGVDSSDHEVNLKILLQLLRQEGTVADLEEGYQLLEEIEETVCADVLDNNYGQTLSLSLDELRCGEDAEPFLDLMDRLGRAGTLDRRDEYLPSRQVVATRQSNKLLRPELSVLLAYSKMFLYRALLESELPASPLARDLLYDYFPQEVVERFGPYLEQHPLAKEIAATMITNRVVDLAGSTFWLTLSRQTGAGLADVAKAYLVFDKLLDGQAMRKSIYALDNRMQSQRQYQLLLRLEWLLGEFCRFALDSHMTLPTDNTSLQRYGDLLARYVNMMADVLPAEEWQECSLTSQQLQDEGVTAVFAERFAVLEHLSEFLPLVHLLADADCELEPLVRLNAYVEEQLQQSELLESIESVPVRDSWDRRARESILAAAQKSVLRIVKAVAAENLEHPQRYFRSRSQEFRNYRGLHEKLRGETPGNFHPYTVLLSVLDSVLHDSGN